MQPCLLTFELLVVETGMYSIYLCCESGHDMCVICGLLLISNNLSIALYLYSRKSSWRFPGGILFDRSIDTDQFNFANVEYSPPDGLILGR